MTPSDDAGPWNPGIQSPVPAEFRHLATIFRPEYVSTSIQAADELHDLTGIAATELVAFRPQRLALHELLIRITADFSVADGSRIEDLGINFRQMTRQLLVHHIEPAMADIVSEFDRVRQRLAQVIHGALSQQPYVGVALSSTGRMHRGGLFRRFTTRRVQAAPPATDHTWEVARIATYERQAVSAADELDRAAYRALARVMSALFNRHGRAWGSRNLIASLVTDLACNEVGSDHIGQLLEPLLQRAASVEGYYRLPPQELPVIMNTKGPSAAGKSSLRPLQRQLAGEIGVKWSDFALISPDIWRKQLLDYQTLGPAYKYAGPLTADELQIIDVKLDRYMARKYQRGDMSHLLIDRFRFDSFALNSDEAGSNLLTRFGQTVYLFFLIAPPESLVERAWNRGLEFGRYKAVGDTLAHSIQAYAGIPDLFFTWARRADKSVHFEFLDNSVRLGEPPRTVAFGDNDRLNVLDVGGILNIERFRHINVGATCAEQLYPDRARLAPEHNTAFLQRCIERFREVNFAEQSTGRIYLRIVSAKPHSADREMLSSALTDSDTLAGVRAVAPGALDGALPGPERAQYLQQMNGARTPTLGQWGQRRVSGESVCA